MRHSAFVCPAASINYDLLKWILLGTLWSWPEYLDGYMYLFLNKCIIQWTHVAQMMHRYSVSTEVISICGKMEQGERPRDSWVCPILNVTQCARTMWHQDLIGVSCHLGFPRHSDWITLLPDTAHVLYKFLFTLFVSSFFQLSQSEPSPGICSYGI